MATTTVDSAKTNINSFETTAWRYMRWSGVLLIPLAFGHLLIMHIINSVYVIDYEWVINTRWQFLPWRLYDAGLLWLAGLHGFNGLRVVINDYVHNPSTNRLLKWGLIGLLVIVFAVGTGALVFAPRTPVDLPETFSLFIRNV
jgi:succinate dehydrogenase / fumarate reductase membrane anchor subunit